MRETSKIATLLYKEIRNDISGSDLKELEAWKNKNTENLKLYNKVKNTRSQLNKVEIYKLFNKDKAWKNLENELFKKNRPGFFLQYYLKIAAVLIPALLVTGILFYISKYNSREIRIANLNEKIQPGTQKAVLVLSDGGEIHLDQSKVITEKANNNATIKNEDGALVYKISNEKDNKKQKLIFNELKTPRGGGYNLELADGSMVWLNAGSSLKFPVSFSGSVRQVFLQGEGYFDVMPGNIPFIVTTSEVDVEVLGTSFNVSAYRDDQNVVTTLVEGKVKLLSNSQNVSTSAVLTPDKQAVFSKDKPAFVIKEVETDQYTSWMEGRLEFVNEPLYEVMRKMSRWYDFEYRFENEQSGSLHFTASFSNTENITDILEILEMTANVKFDFKDNILVIL